MFTVEGGRRARTDSISEARKDPPPPFFPFSATIAPRNRPWPPIPPFPRRIFVSWSKRSGIRVPDPIMREDSSTNDASFSLRGPEDDSESTVMRPTTITSSYTPLRRDVPSARRNAYLSHCGGVAKLLNIVVLLHEFAKVVYPVVQDYLVVR